MEPMQAYTMLKKPTDYNIPCRRDYFVPEDAFEDSTSCTFFFLPRPLTGYLSYVGWCHSMNMVFSPTLALTAALALDLLPNLLFVFNILIPPCAVALAPEA